MKLTLIGGGGVRSPLFVASALRRAGRVRLTELCLMDTDAEKLALFGGLCREVVRQADSNVRLTLTSDPREALEGARYVVTAIRVGGERGRVLDERIALRHGVLGQETTGPGGFAMALRSIPAILGYAELLEQVSPGAWLFNFTNPAGLVAQALHTRGFKRAVGICDSANAAQHAVSAWHGIPPQHLRAEVFGLNHLSWTRRVQHNDRDLLGPLLREPDFLSGTLLRLFDPALVRQIGMWLNEYLFYYYYAEQALASIGAHEQTRGEEVLALTMGLMDQLRTIGVEQAPEAALAAYHAYQQRRHASYMPYSPAEGKPAADSEHANNASAGTPTQHSTLNTQHSPEGEGYAGVALGIIEALETGEPLHTALNVANQGAIAGLHDDDVVEVSCRVDAAGVRPLPIIGVPEPQELLMRAVKLYERLTVAAVFQRSRPLAIQALMAHPLVLSYPRARVLVDEYLAAHEIDWE
ncbi:MAG: glycosyl hydrolase [Roseiflexaceae bacterium]